MAELTEPREVSLPPLGPAPTAPPAAAPSAEEGAVMTLVEHLTELRRRLIIAIAAVVLGSIVGYIFTPDIIRLLEVPIRRAVYFTSPGGAFFLQLKIALMVGIALASPIILYELWSFVSPGLTARERRLLRPWLPLALVFTVLGVAVAYLILPLATGFLLGFQIPGAVEPLITADNYFGFVTTMFIAFGLTMQFPIVLVLLARVGIIKVEWMRRNRRIVFLGIFIFAVIATPGGDPYSPTILTLVMYPLYEFTIWMVGRSEHSRSNA